MRGYGEENIDYVLDVIGDDDAAVAATRPALRLRDVVRAASRVGTRDDSEKLDLPLGLSRVATATGPPENPGLFIPSRYQMCTPAYVF